MENSRFRFRAWVHHNRSDFNFMTDNFEIAGNGAVYPYLEHDIIQVMQLDIGIEQY